MSIKSTLHVTRMTAIDQLAGHYAQLLGRLHTKSNEELGNLLDGLADNNEAGLSMFNNFIVDNENENGADQ